LRIGIAVVIPVFKIHSQVKLAILGLESSLINREKHEEALWYDFVSNIFLQRYSIKFSLS
jgi:hypothetical protein